jgi:hypothetical protein
MDVSKKILEAWRGFLTSSIKLEMEMHQIINHLNETFKEELGTDNDKHFIINHTRFKIEWTIDRQKEHKVGSAIPVKVYLVSEDDSIGECLIDYLSQHLPEKGELLLQRATFKLT